MKNIFTILSLLLFAVAFGQTGPATTVNGKVTYNYLPAGTNNRIFLTKNASTLQLESMTGRLLSDSEYNQLFYVNNATTFTVTPTIGERGVPVANTLNYNIIPNSDVFTAASINQGIGSVFSDVGNGAQVRSAGNKTATTTYTLSLAYTRLGVATNEIKTATYTPVVPQWSGVSSVTDFSNYGEINGEGFQKYIQTNSVISKVVSPENKYIWFIVNNGTGQILDGNNFVQTIGTFGDGVSEFYRKSLVLTLNDGTTATVYLIRSRNTKTLTDFTYKSN